MSTTRVSFDGCNHNFISVVESHGVYSCAACGLRARKISHKSGPTTWSTHGVAPASREGVVFPRSYGYQILPVATKRTVKG